MVFIVKQGKVVGATRIMERRNFRLLRRAGLFLYLLAVLVRLIYSLYYPPRAAFSTPDCERYYASGLFFAQTGQICYPVPVRSAWIMPGLTVLVGTLARLFPEDAALLWAIRICFILIGSLAPVFIYRSTGLFVPKGFAVFSAACFFLPWYIQIDCGIQTEGPAFGFFAAALYFGLLSSLEPGRLRHTLLFSLFLLLGICFRASTLFLFPCVLVWQLLCRRAPLRVVLRGAGVVCAVLALGLLPWAVRNARVFHDFIPLTYASGDPVYEGSFIGDGAPDEEELLALGDGFDPYAKILEEHPSIFDEQGVPLDDSAEQYVQHLYLAVTGRYRLRQWFRLRPRSFLKAYLYQKPRSLLNDVWYWDQVMGISLQTAVRLRQGNLLLCLLAAVLSLVRKKLRRPVWFLGLSYVVNLYIVAASLPLDRYGQAIMPYRLVLGALGLWLLVDFLQSLIARLFPGTAEKG